MQFMAEMMFAKMQEKNHYCLYYMNVNADTCIKERRKRALPELRGGDDDSTYQFVVFYIFYSLLLSSFLSFVDIVIDIYHML